MQRSINKSFGKMKVVANNGRFGKMKKTNGDTESEGSGFGKLVFGVVAGNGYDTSNMEFEEAYRIFKQLGGKENWKAKEIDAEAKEKQQKEAQEDKPKEEEPQKTKRDEQVESIKKHLSTKGATEEQTKQIMEAIEKLGDEEVGKLNYGFDKVRSMALKGYSGSTSGRNIYLNIGSPRAIDKKLGYTIAMETLTHETGHALDSAIDLSARNDVVESAQTSKDEILQNLAKEGGLAEGIKNTSRIQRAERQAVWAGLKKVILGDLQEMKFKWESDFGIIQNPDEKHWFKFVKDSKDEEEYVVKQLRERGYSVQTLPSYLEPVVASMKEDFRRRKEDYEKEKKQFEEAEKSGANEKAKAEYKKYRAEYDANQTEINARKNSLGIISDFLSIATEGKFDTAGEGYYAHGASYAKHKNTYGMSFGGAFSRIGRSAQSEFWAEYYQAKIMKDDKAIETAKRIMPTLANKMEEVYKSLEV